MIGNMINKVIIADLGQTRSFNIILLGLKIPRPLYDRAGSSPDPDTTKTKSYMCET